MKRLCLSFPLLLSGALALAALTGCGVTQTRQGFQIGLDHAEIFGSSLATFQLADGSDGNLRRGPNGEYSLKLQRYYRVLPLDKAQHARIAKVAYIAGRTSVLVELQEKNCGLRYSLFSIEGSKVRNWIFGNCTDRPRTFVDVDVQVFEFPKGRNIIRYELTGEGLTSYQFKPAADYVFTRPFADEYLQMPEAATSPYAGAAPQGSTIRAGRVIPPPPIHVASAGKTGEKSDPDSSPARQPSQPKPKRADGPPPKVTGPVIREEVRPVRVLDLLTKAS